MTGDFEQSLIAQAVKSLTPRQITVLRLVAAGRDLVCESGSAYVGTERTAPRTIYALLRVCAISLEDGGKGSFERYRINGTGKEILRRLEARCTSKRQCS
jgi:hypothetical protein